MTYKTAFFVNTSLAILTGLMLGIIATQIISTDAKPVNAQQTSDKNQSSPNPYRPYYDLFGNQFSYDGMLMHAVCPNVPDPISGKDNPYCICSEPTVVQGSNPETNATICDVPAKTELPALPTECEDK